MPATVERLEYDPNRTGFIALVKYVDREQAYIICSVAVDLKISQVVDAPNMLVSAFLPEDIFVS